MARARKADPAPPAPESGAQGVDVATVARLFSLTDRRVQQLAKEGVIPRAVRGRYQLVPCVQGYIRYLQQRAEGRPTGASADDIAAAKLAKTRGEARLIEIQIAEQEARLVTAEDVEAVAGEIGDRLRAVLINLPSNYVLHLERAGVPPEKGQAVLEEIAEELTRALRGAVEEIDDPAD